VHALLGPRDAVDVAPPRLARGRLGPGRGGLPGAAAWRGASTSRVNGFTDRRRLARDLARPHAAGRARSFRPGRHRRRARRPAARTDPRGGPWLDARLLAGEWPRNAGRDPVPPGQLLHDTRALCPAGLDQWAITDAL